MLTASMHTRSFAVNKPVALAAAAAGATAAAATADADMQDADGSSEQQQDGSRQGSGPLKPLNGNPRSTPSTKAAAGSGGAGAGGSQAPPNQQSQPAYRPERLVRTDHR